MAEFTDKRFGRSRGVFRRIRRIAQAGIQDVRPCSRAPPIPAAPAPDDALHVSGAFPGGGSDGRPVEQGEVGLGDAPAPFAYELSQVAVNLHGIFDGAGYGQVYDRSYEPPFRPDMAG